MPRGNKTGPEGVGPLTGRRMGYCAGNEFPGYVNRAGAGRAFRGFQGGRGQRMRGFGYQRGFMPENQVSTQDQETFLKHEISNLKGQLELLEKQLQNISNKE